MMDRIVPSAVGDAAVASLRNDVARELARGDSVADSVLPILRHLILAEDGTLFSEELLTRVRGMAADLAAGLLDALVREPVVGLPRSGCATRLPTGDVDMLVRALLERPELLTHLHALALEWQLAERLQIRLALDPVVSPMVQDLIAAPDDTTRDLSAAFLAAQSRWCQSQRRMQLGIEELPVPALEAVLATLRALGGAGSPIEARAAALEAAIRAGRTPGQSRIDLALALIASDGGATCGALSIGHAGVALFLTALAVGSAQSRDAVALWTHETQATRLALALRAAGASAVQADEQFLALHPARAASVGAVHVDGAQAASLLSERGALMASAGA